MADVAPSPVMAWPANPSATSFTVRAPVSSTASVFSTPRASSVLRSSDARRRWLTRAVTTATQLSAQHTTSRSAHSLDPRLLFQMPEPDRRHDGEGGDDRGAAGVGEESRHDGGPAVDAVDLPGHDELGGHQGQQHRDPDQPPVTLPRRSEPTGADHGEARSVSAGGRRPGRSEGSRRAEHSAAPALRERSLPSPSDVARIDVVTGRTQVEVALDDEGQEPGRGVRLVLLVGLPHRRLAGPDRHGAPVAARDHGVALEDDEQLAAGRRVTPTTPPGRSDTVTRCASAVMPIAPRLKPRLPLASTGR